jgi:hypothetical protein
MQFSNIIIIKDNVNFRKFNYSVLPQLFQFVEHKYLFILIMKLINDSDMNKIIIYYYIFFLLYNTYASNTA